jgi:hypothetical protein
VLPKSNIHPVAKAGDDLAVSFLKNEFTLNGGESYDADGTIDSYEWKFIKGPSNPLVASNDKSLSKVNTFGSGVYVFELTVKDNEGATGVDTVAVAIVNLMPLKETLRVFPNPAHDHINLMFSSRDMGNTVINIYDAKGGVIRTQAANKSQIGFDRRVYTVNIKPGIYIIEVVTPDKKRRVAKFIKVP